MTKEHVLLNKFMALNSSIEMLESQLEETKNA